MSSPYMNIGVEQRKGYAILHLQRPSALNALNSLMIEEIAGALETLDRGPECRCVILTGSERAFAAGADISEMATADPIALMLSERFASWDRIRRVRLPLIAAVSGYALGGGCELALMCDIIVASDTCLLYTSPSPRD